MNKTDMQIRNYLDGRMETGLLLMGSRYQKMVEDAMKIASSILGISTDVLLNHPDFLRLTPGTKKSLGVDDVLPMLEKAQLRPAISDRQVVLVERFDMVTPAAQNKLLKLIEENCELIVIAIAKEDTVLPTIKSRMRVIIYSPLSITEYGLMYKGGGSLLPTYFATSGDPDGKADEDVLHLFEKVEKSFVENRRGELFEILSQIREKDNNNFFTRYKEYVSSLISLMGTLSLKTGNKEMVALCHENKKKCNLSSYTGNDFFLFVAGVVNGGSL